MYSRFKLLCFRKCLFTQSLNFYVSGKVCELKIKKIAVSGNVCVLKILNFSVSRKALFVCIKKFENILNYIAGDWDFGTGMLKGL